jgi:hypothetical protein
LDGQQQQIGGKGGLIGMAMVRRLLGGALRAYLFLVLFMFASGVLAGAWIALSAHAGDDPGLETAPRSMPRP